MFNSFVTPWIVACKAPLSMGFPRQEYWTGLPFPSPGDQGSNLCLLIVGGILTTEQPDLVNPVKQFSTISVKFTLLEDSENCLGHPNAYITLGYHCRIFPFVKEVGVFLAFRWIIGLCKNWMGEGNGTPLQYFAWKIPWMEEPGGLQSMGSLRVGHDWVTSLSLFTFMHWRRKWQPTPVFLPGESQGWGSLVAAVYGVTQSRTQLKWLNSNSSRNWM